MTAQEIREISQQELERTVEYVEPEIMLTRKYGQNIMLGTLSFMVGEALLALAFQEKYPEARNVILNSLEPATALVGGICRLVYFGNMHSKSSAEAVRAYNLNQKELKRREREWQNWHENLG